jgi:hypothetical protein
MRFSLKWILVGVTYVAVAAAAFSQTTWVYADVLWAASLLAVVYAALVAAFARGRRQVAAAGFVVASVGFLVCLHFANNSVPTLRLLAAAGVGQNTMNPNVYAARPIVRPQPVTITTPTPNGPTQTVQYVEVEEVAVASPTPAYRPTPTPALTVGQWMAQPRVAPPTPYVDFSIYVRAGNAVGMLLFGGLGCVLGLAAHKATRREALG